MIKNFLKKSFQIFTLFVLCWMLFGCKGSQKDHYKGMSAEQIFAQSQTNMDKKKYLDAVKDFEALEARYPYSEFSDRVQLGLTKAYYKRSEAPLAISTADRFIQMHPHHPQVDYALYLKGLVNFDAHHSIKYRYLPLDRSARDPSNARDSFDSFKALVENYPNSEYAADSRKRMVHLRDQLASHEMHVVDYYMKRGAYVAAANRANYIVTNFNGSKVMPRALSTLVVCYDNLKMPEMSQNAQRLLQTNFPENAQ